MDALRAVSPLDGRYAKQTEPLRDIFSEYALVRRRVLVETAWIDFLLGERGLAPVTAGDRAAIRAIADGFNIEAAQRVKAIEARTNHDVKAVEYYVKEQLAAAGLGRIAEWTHFGCTSEDINNIAYALMLREGRDILTIRIETLRDRLVERAAAWRTVPMMARTHGQPATPTTVGKEFVVFAARLDREIEHLTQWRPAAKMNGATGNWNAHRAALPRVDWIDVSTKFLSERLGVEPLLYTTQINPYHYIAEILQILVRVAAAVIDLDRDVWGYISLDYFRQQKAAGEVGSSTMPHKVNPIDFENSEGNMGVAIALMEHLSTKLLASRFQRDLSDSTALRTLGTAFGHFLVGIDSTLRGMGKLMLNEAALAADLAAHPELLAEAVQTVMRLHGEERPYERLKDLTRGEKVSLEEIRRFIAGLSNVPESDRTRLAALTPAEYTGYAAMLVDRYLADQAKKKRSQ